MSELRDTPLHAFHLAHGARMVPFAGWEMPVQYTGILEEHRCVRERVGLFDVSHMGEIFVRGEQAEAFLNYLLTNDIARLKSGFALYSVMCQPTGGVIDDLLVYRFSREDFLLVVNAGNTDKDWGWIQEQAMGFNCTVENQSERYALLALQGPNAGQLMETLTSAAKELKRLAITTTEIAGHSVFLARSGYTGENGFEIFIQSSEAIAVAEAIVAAGEAEDLQLIGLGARDSLRMEAGYPLYGHELSETLSPLVAGLRWVVKLEKPNDFIGKAALAREAANGSTERVIWFTAEGRRIPRMDTVVFSEGMEVGRILSGTLSPLTNSPIGSALIPTSAIDSRLEVDLRGTRIQIHPKRPPLHK